MRRKQCFWRSSYSSRATLRITSQCCICIRRLLGAQVHASLVSQKEHHSEKPHLFKKSVYFGTKDGELTQKHGNSVSNHGDYFPIPYSEGTGQRLSTSSYGHQVGTDSEDSSSSLLNCTLEKQRSYQIKTRTFLITVCKTSFQLDKYNPNTFVESAVCWKYSWVEMYSTYLTYIRSKEVNITCVHLTYHICFGDEHGDLMLQLLMHFKHPHSRLQFLAFPIPCLYQYRKAFKSK